MNRYLAILFLLCSNVLFSQQQNFLAINIQAQLLSNQQANFDLRCVVVDLNEDTLWHELHPNLDLASGNTFTVFLGKGDYQSGEQSVFSSIDWRMVKNLRLYDVNNLNQQIANLNLNSVPYALHSLHLEYLPTLINLSDVSGNYTDGSILKYNGATYYFDEDQLYDSTFFAYESGSSLFADSAEFGISQLNFADTVEFSFDADTASYVNQIYDVVYSDSAVFSDTAGFAFYTKSAWQIGGNVAPLDFLGTHNSIDFTLRTNSSERLIFSNSNVKNSPLIGEGFHFNLVNGTLFKYNGTSQNLGVIPDVHMFFDGGKSAFTGGTSTLDTDTLLGNYSFCWGENVGTNGPNSTIFGKNSTGDSSFYAGSTMYESISSFAFGNNCHVAHMGVAIGYNANALYYRNVAIGKNVTCQSQSACVGIGDNVLSSGATSWAMGQNVQATGHFSTALGYAASTNGMNGSFVYGDFSTADTVQNTSNQQFMVRADGGVVLYSSSDLLMGVTLSSGGGSWNMISDRNKKRNISMIELSDTLKPFQNLEVYKWRYKNQTQTHIGPMAQDMFRVFKVGESERYINQIDIDGAVLLGIKDLNEKLKSNGAGHEQVKNIKSEINREKEEQIELEKRIKELYEKFDH